MCNHCRVERLDSGQPELGLCDHCLDLAIWGAECFNCDRIPTGNKKDRCDD